MGNDLFRMSQQPGIYHTYSMWSRLSPHLAKGERKETGLDSDGTIQEAKPEDQGRDSPKELSPSD